MIRTLGGLVVVVLATQAANAQSGVLNDAQHQGRALFNQSCRVCHTPPALNAPLYGPALNQDTQRGRDDVLAEIIAEGSPRMPGFKYQFSPDQITAIVGYLRTVPARQSASSQPAAAPPASAGERERQQREAD
jgi:mono/diheme cytochrome c family protein